MNSNDTGRRPTTIAPVEAAQANAASPEFVDVRGLERMFGIRRSLAYALLADGVITGVSLRRRGQARGKRLFEVESVREYLRGQMQA